MPTEPAPAMPGPGPTAPAPLEPAPTMPGPVPAMPPKTTGISADDSGVLTVWVPFDAKVTVNGLETRSIGSRRQFVSYGLKPGLSYRYVVRAQVERDGQTLVESQPVVLTAGQVNAVAFGFNNTPDQQVAAAR